MKNIYLELKPANNKLAASPITIAALLSKWTLLADALKRRFTDCLPGKGNLQFKWELSYGTGTTLTGRIKLFQNDQFVAESKSTVVIGDAEYKVSNPPGVSPAFDAFSNLSKAVTRLMITFVFQ